MAKQHKYCMITFDAWLDLDLLARLRLVETYFSFDPAAYNRLFDEELEKTIRRITDPEHRQTLESMQGFDWVGYIARSVRNAGYHDYRDVQERTHDVVVKLLTGGLFSNYDETKHGPLDLRFKQSVGNGIRNMVEKDRNRRRLVPTVPIGQQFEPGGVTADDLPSPSAAERDDRVIDDFRRIVGSRLGELGLTVLDGRLAGEETKSLVGRADLNYPGKYVIKRVVQEIKALAREYADTLGDPAFMREVRRAMEREGETVRKRLAGAGKRQR